MSATRYSKVECTFTAVTYLTVKYHCAVEDDTAALVYHSTDVLFKGPLQCPSSDSSEDAFLEAVAASLPDYRRL